jgi:hypothetical protein
MEAAEADARQWEGFGVSGAEAERRRRKPRTGGAAQAPRGTGAPRLLPRSPAGVRSRSRKLSLLPERPRGATEPTEYWLAKPPEAGIQDVVRPAHYSCTVERQYPELNHQFGLDISRFAVGAAWIIMRRCVLPPLWVPGRREEPISPRRATEGSRWMETEPQADYRPGQPAGGAPTWRRFDRQDTQKDYRPPNLPATVCCPSSA